MDVTQKTQDEQRFHVVSGYISHSFTASVVKTCKYSTCQISARKTHRTKCSSSTAFHIESPLNREPCRGEQSQACGCCKNSAISQRHRSLSRNWAPVSLRLHFSQRLHTHVYKLVAVGHSDLCENPVTRLLRREADLCFSCDSSAPVRHMMFSRRGWQTLLVFTPRRRKRKARRDANWAEGAHNSAGIWTIHHSFWILKLWLNSD